MKWVRLNDKLLRNTSKCSERMEAQTWGLAGKLWPRISVTVGEHWTGKGCAITWSYKEEPGTWWDEKRPLPAEILAAVPAMITAYLSRRTEGEEN